MARSSRLKVCLAMVMRNSSKIHCARSISRQRTTPWTAGIGPLSIISRERLALSIIELRGLARRFAVEQPVRTACIEPHHPVPNDLKTDAADLRRLGARRTVVDRRKRQKPSGLRSVLCLLRHAARGADALLAGLPLLGITSYASFTRRCAPRYPAMNASRSAAVAKR